MAQKENVLFITDKGYVDYKLPGGVQICTEEFIRYLNNAGFNIIIIKVSPDITLLKRIKLKLGIETYELYDSKIYISEIVNAIVKNQVKFVLFNQLNIAHWATLIRAKISIPLKCIGLSHGNESGDYLYEITKQDKVPTLIETWRIGKLIAKEKILFSTTLDAVVTISEHESYIDQWLGADKILFLPRILEPKFIKWEPEKNVIGFVGTLDHYPNYQGIELLANQLHVKAFNGILKLIGGPKSVGEKLARKYSFISYLGHLSNEELFHEVAKWSIFVNPIFWYARGSSTKASQIINWGIPILSTKAGIRGYHLSNTNFLTKQNKPEHLAALVIKKLGSTSELNTLKKISEGNASTFEITKWSAELKAFLEEL
ncbi:glycosyltransferase family protein [Pedobacter frigiditerrae]|uniref:glycosyltransferase n=1 Tax=Pedobacter frigiditerrae TaxID=2530452 RepID=UPI0013F17A31|nr:glycosyltransferase [Pedobacter frigiditerrae]